jgi:hypothetical protein
MWRGFLNSQQLRWPSRLCNRRGWCFLSIHFHKRLLNRWSLSQSRSYGTTDGQSASLSWCQAPIWGTWPDLYYSQLRVCWCETPSLTKGLVCSLELLLCLASAVNLGSESRRTLTIVYCLKYLSLPQPAGPGPRTYITQEQGGPVILPVIGFDQSFQWVTGFIAWCNQGTDSTEYTT